MKRELLTDRMLQMVEKSQREALGLKTMDEKVSEAEVKSERELHKQVGNLLRLRGIEFFESRMDRKTTMPVGTPDFLFSVIFSDVDKCTQKTNTWPVACAWECKVENRPLDPEQQKMFCRMTSGPNAWCTKVIRSVDEALAELKKLGF